MRNMGQHNITGILHHVFDALVIQFVLVIVIGPSCRFRIRDFFHSIRLATHYP